MVTFDFLLKQKMTTLLEIYKVFTNHLCEPLVSQDDVNNIRKTVEYLIMKFSHAKLEESRFQAS